ncbi:MAG: P1 family peptidase, partial [Syntrophales bacterium]|nr:P1 family peptidase [Syntrophales bacterium]
RAARTEPQGDGSVGAGTGATIGKLLGVPQATKGGLGTSFLEGPQGLKVGALAVVNAFGDVVDPQTGEILAGARTAPTSREFADAVALLRQGVVRRRFGEPSNTTIGVVATNAHLSREEAQKIAQMSQNGLARCIRPVHTLFDGDTIFVLAHPEVEVDLHIVGLLAETAVSQAIISAVKSAHGLGVLPSYQDLRGQ